MTAKKNGRAAAIDALRAKLNFLAESPLGSEVELQHASELLAELIAGKAQPDMSIGALLRWNAPDVLSAELRHAVRGRALSMLAAHATKPEGTAQAPAWEGEWLTVQEAARELKVQESTLLERLRSWQHRRRLGWPYWDGHRWLIPSPAVDPATAAAFLSALPAREPLAELLPHWCERQHASPERAERVA